jgi:hypothetical protein
MSGHSDMMGHVRKSAAKRILYLPHAIRQMSRPSRMISIKDVRNVLQKGQLVDDYLAVITAYIPSLEEWEDHFRKRKNQ